MSFYWGIESNDVKKQWLFIRIILLLEVELCFCKAKDTVSKTKLQPTDWEKIFTNYASNRVQMFNKHKHLKKLDSREPNNLIKNRLTM
jgi:cytochrome c biogenesis protein ResB